MFQETGVDGIMIGRGSFGNPWIFQEIEHFLKTGEKLQEPSNLDKLEIIKQHIDLAVKEKGEIAIKELRKHIAWYTKNLKNSSEFRNDINKIETEKELIDKIEEYFKTL
jgi:tRNA-dihydrouridine synthase B